MTLQYHNHYHKFTLGHYSCLIVRVALNQLLKPCITVQIDVATPGPILLEYKIVLDMGRWDVQGNYKGDFNNKYPEVTISARAAKWREFLSQNEIPKNALPC